jgi:hypothetical protein
MAYLIENADGSHAEISVQLKRVYARACRKFEIGLWGIEPERVKCVTLTTGLNAVMDEQDRKGESRNNWKQMVQDNRFLRQRMAKDGLPYQDCFCSELSPNNHLIHLHGFMRFEKYYSFSDIHEKLSKHWGDIHNSPVVWVKDMWDVKGAIAYDVKHTLKNYIGERFEYGGRPPRILCSKGWLPPGWRKVQKEINRWASEKVDWVPEEDDIVKESYYAHEYVPFKWEVAKDMMQKWCEGQEVYLERMGIFTELLWGDTISILEYEVEPYDESGEIENQQIELEDTE